MRAEKAFELALPEPSSRVCVIIFVKTESWVVADIIITLREVWSVQMRLSTRHLARKLREALIHELLISSTGTFIMMILVSNTPPWKLNQCQYYYMPLMRLQPLKHLLESRPLCLLDLPIFVLSCHSKSYETNE